MEVIKIKTINKPSIKDVAKEAGVSITTVSRVLNGSYPVNKTTKTIVMDAINKLNYQPNAIARGLVIKKTNTIGVIVPYITNMFFTEVVEGLADQCKNNGYNLILSHTESNPNEEMKAVNNLIARQVDGVIIIDPFIEAVSLDFYRNINRRIPLLIVNKYFPDNQMTFVFNDEFNGAYKATQYLLNLGHKKILFISGFDGYASNVKKEGFVRALEDNGISLENQILKSDFTSQGTYSLVKKEMNLVTRFSAIFCANDLMAIGVIKALTSNSFKVPADFSVMGFDNISIASLFQPELTTVSQNIYTLGKVSGETILKKIEQKKVPNKRILKTKLIIRGSCQKQSC